MPIPFLLLSVGTSVTMRLAMDRVLQRTGASASGSSSTMAALQDIATNISRRDQSEFFDYIARGLESLGRASYSPTEELRKGHLQRAHDQFQTAAAQSVVQPNELIAGLRASRWMALAKIGQSAVFAARSEDRNFANVMDEAKALDPRIYDLFIDAQDRTATLTSLLNTASQPSTVPQPQAPVKPVPPNDSSSVLGCLFAAVVTFAVIVCLVVYLPRFFSSPGPTPSEPPQSEPLQSRRSYQIHGQTSATSLGSQVVTIHAVQQGSDAGIYYENQGSKEIQIISTFQCALLATCKLEGYTRNQADFTVGPNNHGHIVVDNADAKTLLFDSTIFVPD